MSAPPSPSPCPAADTTGLVVIGLTFLQNGPYSFAVEPGSCLGVTGESGVGKSLMLKALADLLPHEGTVCHAGTSSDSLPAPEWRSLVGLVPAEGVWWADTVAGHFPPGDADQQAELFAALGFPPAVGKWQIQRLSTGERQRLTLLRALARKPQVLLLDEPTSALDSGNIQRVESLLARYRQDERCCMLWVSHDRQQLDRVADRVLQQTPTTLRPLA